MDEFQQVSCPVRCFLKLCKECIPLSNELSEMDQHCWHMHRVATVREKCLENDIFSRSGKSQGILWMVREIQKGLGKSGN